MRGIGAIVPVGLYLQLVACGTGREPAAPDTGLDSLLVFTSVATGGAHTCALTPGGAAHCWGRGESGQLGQDPPQQQCALEEPWPCSPTPVAVGGARSFTRLTGGGAHTCGLAADGSAWCWGRNHVGQLGDGTTTTRFAPVAVATTLRFSAIDAGAEHTCALTAAGAAHCWGRNQRGQLGDGSTILRDRPVAVAGGVAFTQISAGGYLIGHTCGLATSGRAYCWGDNERGQLGIGTADDAPHPAPVSVAGDVTYSTISAGLGLHTCATATGGDAYCWGYNGYGAIGDGSTTNRSTPARVIDGLAFARSVAGGFYGHSCALVASGAAYCWGDNEVGQVGDGSTTQRTRPTAVSGTLTFASIDAGFRHSCGRATTGTIYCWGSGRAGQLGTATAVTSDVPARVVRQR